MPTYTMEELDARLARLFDSEPPSRFTDDLNAALRAADVLEAEGYSFQLKDMCPKSLSDNLWRATFTHGGKKFQAEDPEASVAVCVAAVTALRKTGKP